jgi:hypothetical protein
MLALSPIKILKEDRKLIAWWKFDEAEGGKAVDSSGNNIIGMLNGNPQWQPSGGKVGGALAFDGDGDFIDFGHDEGLNITGAVTISAWIKLAKSTDDQKIAGNQDDISGGYKLSIYSNKAELEVRDSDNSLINNRFIDGGTVLQPDVWYHVVGTYSQGGSIKTYVNGKLDREQGTTKTLAASSGSLKIGREPFNDLYVFNGLMDEVSIYNYALSEADVTEIYSGKSPLAVVPIATLAAGEQSMGWVHNFVPVLVIMIIAVVIVGLVTRRKQVT